MKPKKVCVHCRDPKRAVNRPRGLCWECYYQPGVKDLYASRAKSGWGREPTEEELDRLIEQQRKNLPKWWTQEMGNTED